jgi:cytochrome c biogenesis protein CcdA/glutaredoxin
MDRRRVRLRGVVAALLLLVGLLAAGAPALARSGGELADQEPVVWYFWGDGCPHCATQKPYVDGWAERYPELEIRSLEVWHDEANRALFAEQATLRGIEPSGVPATFIGGTGWVGFHEGMLPEMEAALQALAGRGPPQGPAPESTGASTTLPLVGEVDLAAGSLVGLTVLIGFVDGFNPCSLWVLSVLLAMILRTGSRRNVVIVGLTFLTITTLVYGVFVAGVFSALSYIGYLGWVRVAVAVLAIGYGLVNIKDFLWFKRGLSFTIPERAKPGIYRRARGIMAPDRSLLGMVGATAVMAVGISTVELACTAGFPVLWSTALAERGVETAEFLGLLGIYMGVYLLDELALFLVVVATMRVTRMQERHGRALKLVGGMLMLALAVALLTAPEAMSSLTGTLVVFGAALAGAGVLAALERRARGRSDPDAPTDAAARELARR